VDVFTTRRFGGNPLAVFPDASGIDPSWLQPIARELNLSETTFVLPPREPGCDVRVRIFTPRAELPMAGHPTLGTAFVLAGLRDGASRFVFELGVGPVPVERAPAGDGTPLWWMTQPRPRFGAAPSDPGRAAAALGLALRDLDPALPVQVVDAGVPFAMVALADLDALARARVRGDAWAELASELDGAEPYAFVATGAGRARARMWASLLGWAEDPATGSAAGPLGAYLAARGRLPAEGAAAGTLRVEQGVEMGRASEIHVEVERSGDQVAGIRVGGACVPVAEGRLELPGSDVSG